MEADADKHTEAARRYGRRMARWVVLACELCIIAGWVMQQFSSDGQWITVTVALIPPPLWLIPAAIAVGAAIAGRDRFSIAAALVLIPLVLFGLMGAQWRPGSNQSRGETITVMTWNVRNQHQQAAAVRQTIDQVDADICLMQEAFDRRFAPHFSDGQCKRIGTQRVCLMHPSSSNCRISSIREVALEGGYGDALSATIEVGERSFTILNTHIARRNGSSTKTSLATLPIQLRQSHESRRTQIESIARWARNREGPFIIAGDFNTPPSENIFGPLRTAASDAFAKAGRGLGYTFPNFLPLYRIDGIWVSKHFHVLDAGVFETPISDHRPVWAELQISE